MCLFDAYGVVDSNPGSHDRNFFYEEGGGKLGLSWGRGPSALRPQQPDRLFLLPLLLLTSFFRATLALLASPPPRPRRPQGFLVRRGLLRDVQAKEPEVHLQYLRERRVVVVRGRREKAERVAALLQVAVHGGGLDRDGVRSCID